MATSYAYVGAIFSLLLTLGGVVGAVGVALGELTGPPGGVVATVIVLGLISVISGYIVVTNDWPRIWKPLLGKS